MCKKTGLDIVRKYSKFLQEIKGVTISELVIALTIVSILVVFATSTYSNYATITNIANQVSLLHMLVRCII
ncbi:MAG: prepilin-type N-terminal cleavage/methylation domain-containing protein [Francisella endosymbiont of Hyalomma asiaticum]